MFSRRLWKPFRGEFIESKRSAQCLFSVVTDIIYAGSTYLLSKPKR
jgi:hypothetical protein